MYYQIKVGNARGYGTDIITPIFISCDPKRDSVKSIKEYVAGIALLTPGIYNLM